jgi:hypothetical protein
MAESPSHKFGQIIGGLLEKAVEPFLQDFANEYDLYLDKKGPRPARSGARVVTWKDLRGNKHDLDFVLEKNGSHTRTGTPAAFIETAWRRYTKHSKNKAQEIQGAIMSLVETYSHYGPFAGTILAGVFTKDSIIQLESLHFTVLYFPYENIVRAFNTVNIDASFDEKTLDVDFARKVTSWEALSDEQKHSVASKLIDMHKEEIAQFLAALKRSVTRQVELVRIFPLYSTAFIAQSIEEAITFVEGYQESSSSPGEFIRYEVEIRYVSGDVIRANLREKERVIECLRTYLPATSPAYPQQLGLFRQVND